MENNQNIDNRREIEEIKNRIDIVDFISQYINVKRAGRNYSAVCPFHQEKTPSFMISPDLQMYKCFGCGESGDIFEFVMKYEHLDFPETLEKLAKQGEQVYCHS
jgi:DNA primase